MKSTLGEGRDQSARTHPPFKNNQEKKTQGENSLGQGTKSPHSEPTMYVAVHGSLWGLGQGTKSPQVHVGHDGAKSPCRRGPDLIFKPRPTSLACMWDFGRSLGGIV